MPTSLATLVARTRRFVGDFPEQDSLTASVSAGGTTLTVADESIYSKGWTLEIEQENMVVSTDPTTGTSLDVRRGAHGTTAATHANASTILIRPAFTYTEILDAINWAKDEMYPYVYKDVLDATLSTSSNTFEYTIPNLGGVPIRHVRKVEFKYSGETDYREIRGYSIRRGATPKLQLGFEPEASSTIRIHGYAPFPDLATGDSLDAQWPENATKLLPIGAASYLLASGEARRVRGDIAVSDSREQANRTGSSMSASNALYNRFKQGILNAAMPPLSPHVTPTF